MSNYITEKMASVGCGYSDTIEISKICKSLTEKQKDILDTWYNIGFVELKDEYKKDADTLMSDYTKDDLSCISAYVSAERNIS